MKLKVLTEAGLELLEHNIEANIKRYQKTSNEWIYEFLDTEHIKEFHTEVPDFELIVCKKETAKADVENVKMVYSNLKFLTNEQASDDRFWTGLAHLNFWKFMGKRWDIGVKGQDVNNVKGRYFVNISSSHRRSLIVNTISRYWWVGRKLYDKDAEDPFHLLKFFEVDYSTKTLDLLSSSYANNDEIIRATVESFMALEEEMRRRLTREEIRPISAYLNILGGISVLDHFDRDDLNNKIRDRFYKENNQVHKNNTA